MSPETRERQDAPRRAPLVAGIAASYAALACLMTWPLARHLLSRTWLGVARPGSRVDFYNHIWNYWFVASGRAADAGGPFGTTELLFYPQGFDLAFHTLDLVHVALVSALAPLLGWVGGFNAAGLLLLVASALAAYALLRDLAHDRWSAWFGGAVFGFTSWSLFHLTLHPDLMTLCFLPATALAFRRAIRDGGSAGWAVLGGVALALNGYASLYLLAIAALTLGALVVAAALADRRWRQRRFWLRLAILAAVGALLLLPRLAPMLGRGELRGVLEQKLDAESSVDLLRLVVPYDHPWAPPDAAARRLAGPESSLLLPALPLLLVAVALLSRRERRAAGAWAALGLLFAGLVLGSRLEIGGRELLALPMPRDLLIRLLPFPFEAFRDSKLFFPGTLLPLAVAAAAGMRALLRDRTPRARSAIALAALAVTLLEVHPGAFRPVELGVSEFYRRLAATPGDGALIELPFGRPQSKRYVYFQTVHGRPIQEGSISRESPRARDFIAGNGLLRAWRAASRPGAAGVPCAALGPRRIAAAVTELRRSGFELVVVHADAPEAIGGSLAHLEPAYVDAKLRVYRVADLERNPPCGAAAGG